MMTAGALIRQFFVMRHGFKLGRNANPLPYALAGVAVIAALVGGHAPTTGADRYGVNLNRNLSHDPSRC